MCVDLQTGYINSSIHLPFLIQLVIYIILYSPTDCYHKSSVHPITNHQISLGETTIFRWVSPNTVHEVGLSDLQIAGRGLLFGTSAAEGRSARCCGGS